MWTVPHCPAGDSSAGPVPITVTRMKIAHLATSITINQVILGRMIRQRSMGHEITALCPDDAWAVEIRRQGFRVIDVPWLRHDVWATPRAMFRTWSVCRRERFDVVDATNALPGLLGSLAARAAGRSRVVHTIRAWPLNESRSLAQRLAVSIIEPVAARACDAVLFQNPDDMKAWMDLRGVPRDRAALVGNGIDIEALDRRLDPTARRRIRREFDIPERAFVVSTVARFEPAKGHAQLLSGLKLLCERPGPPVVLLLAGTGEGEGELRGRVQRLGLTDAVRFTGYRDDIPDLLLASDVAALTSLYEGIPRALMESMAAGLPVVATDVPGTRSLVVDGQTGRLVPLGDDVAVADALHELRSDPSRAREFGRNGRLRVEAEFDERKISARTVAVYEHVWRRAGGPLPTWSIQSARDTANELG